MRTASIILILTCAVLLFADTSGAQVPNTTKPWTRWWWPGNAVDKANLTRQLELLAAAGIGGVEITPIYGAQGYEERYIDFLSPRYVEMLGHAVREARRLGLGVDMATGTGWPFGGPWVPERDGSMRIALKDGKLAGEPTRMKVKRAAPGGEGFVLDPFSPEALARYLRPFDRPLSQLPRGFLRGQFHDSFEYYNASWTGALPEVFARMHGYDIQKYAEEIMGRGNIDPATLARIKGDYRETLAQLHLHYVKAWAAWSKARGCRARNQAHGAPGNLLDLYAAAHIPETEIFGSTPFPIPGLRRDADAVRHDQDLPDPLISRFASSAAHVAGRPLVSSESCTWLRDHWKVSLAYTKPELDRVMLDGINHIFYHGTVYSPQEAPWPGWLFYASTQFNPSNTWWDDFAALNRYIERVQAVLQGGTPDNDILLYWPIYDIWDNPEGLAIQLTVHSTAAILKTPFGRAGAAMAGRGYAFDYISDAQLEQTRFEGGRFVTPGSRYSVLVVPAARRMPPATLARILRLAREGATVVMEALPEDVPGYGRLQERQAELRSQLGTLRFAPVGSSGLQVCRLGKGELIKGEVLSALELRGVRREPLAETGIGLIRRAGASGHDYFLANLTSKAFEGWAEMGIAAKAALIVDPLSGTEGAAAVQPGTGGRAQIFVQLAPGESLILHAPARGNARGRPWSYQEPAGPPLEIKGKWRIEFVKGGPALPPAVEMADLRSWTDLGGDEARRFGGTARYRIEFEMPDVQARAWVLDLGDVRESARVRLNGREVATAWSLPFRVRLDDQIMKMGRNVLELDVTNLAANRIREMDRRGEPWKIMREINFVNIEYKPFDASKWELQPSGLLGPVRLQPMRPLDPGKSGR